MHFNLMEREKFIIEKGSNTENVFLIVLSGSFELFLNDQKFTAGRNDVLYFRKGVPFRRRVTSPLRLIYISCTEEMPVETGPLFFSDRQRSAGTIRLLLACLKQQRPHFCRPLLEDLLLQRKIETQLENSPAFSKETVLFMEYAENNPDGRILIRDFAGRMFMTPNGFIRKFKKETGQTPAAYLADCRMKKACGLLLDTRLGIGEIASLCGFENLYYFSNSFKKAFHMSPSDYRKNNV